MTQSTAESRALLIKKLLNKAEARGTTPEEAEAFTAKATALMIQWGIDDAMIANADRLHVEEIIQHRAGFNVPKSYSYEYAVIVVGIADQLGCRGIYSRQRNGETHVLIIGFTSDVERVKILGESLILQCVMALATRYTEWVNESFYAPSGTEKFNWKRSFIVGFAKGVSAKLRESRRVVIADAAPGTDLVLVDRKKKVGQWIDENMSLMSGRARRYVSDGAMSGRAAGRAANIGGTQLGGSSKAVGK